MQMMLKNTESVDPACLKRMEADEQFVLRNTVMRITRLTRILAFTSDAK